MAGAGVTHRFSGKGKRDALHPAFCRVADHHTTCRTDRPERSGRPLLGCRWCEPLIGYRAERDGGDQPAIGDAGCTRCPQSRWQRGRRRHCRQRNAWPDGTDRQWHRRRSVRDHLGSQDAKALWPQRKRARPDEAEPEAVTGPDEENAAFGARFRWHNCRLGLRFGYDSGNG